MYFFVLQIQIYSTKKMRNTSIKPDSFSAWMLAFRPKLLPASAMPVVVAMALTIHFNCFQWIPSLCCLLFAMLAQTASNIADDYFDYKKGSDRSTDRLGPQKACANGYIEPTKVRNAAFATLFSGAAIGCVLIGYGGWGMIGVGLAVCIAAFAYTTGPFPLSYLGLGDLFVLIFYGIVPVGFTYYVQAHNWPVETSIAGVTMGMAATNIMISNNYRDKEADIISRKRTTIVRFGRCFGRYFYLFNCIGSIALCQYYWYSEMPYAAILPVAALPSMLLSWRKLFYLEGKALNQVLFESARNVLLFGILLSVGIVIS